MESYCNNRFKKILKFALGYGCGYGHCKIYETKNNIYFEFFNGGWADNEEEDSKMMNLTPPNINDHPMHVYSFPKYAIDIDLIPKDTIKKKKYIYKYVGE